MNNESIQVGDLMIPIDPEGSHHHCAKCNDIIEHTTSGKRRFTPPEIQQQLNTTLPYVCNKCYMQWYHSHNNTRQLEQCEQLEQLEQSDRKSTNTQQTASPSSHPSTAAETTPSPNKRGRSSLSYKDCADETKRKKRQTVKDAIYKTGIVYDIESYDALICDLYHESHVKEQTEAKHNWLRECITPTITILKTKLSSIRFASYIMTLLTMTLSTTAASKLMGIHVSTLNYYRNRIARDDWHAETKQKSPTDRKDDEKILLAWFDAVVLTTSGKKNKNESPCFNHTQLTILITGRTDQRMPHYTYKENYNEFVEYYKDQMKTAPPDATKGDAPSLSWFLKKCNDAGVLNQIYDRFSLIADIYEQQNLHEKTNKQ
jgi:hypothetical protein